MSSEREPFDDDLHHQLSNHDYSLQADDHRDEGIVISEYEYRRGREYWHARQAFLKSYHFSSSSPPPEEEEDHCEHHDRHDDRQVSGFKGKLKRSMKGLNKTAEGVAKEVRRGIMPKRRLKIRVFRVKLSLHSSLVALTMRCFIPWFSKVEHVQ
ncbi:uncharacterized protein LOC115739284 [Rhodamnia argentea]|uniref:Uncharacterized protein LOC115739284 n=1 Tax=Rhodamnia argentea TaxID=178133 RepID=A0ABM3GT50_9MYRT|nr:uncharacterized protein LOC115739284 [Rhodamnia argentea]